MIVNELPRKYQLELTVYEAKAMVRALCWIQRYSSGPTLNASPVASIHLDETKMTSVGAFAGWSDDLPMLRQLHDVLSAL